MAEFVLHCFAQSGNAYKAALMLALCGADWRPRFVDYFNGETRTPEYRAINEMGEVPVLEAEGRLISQSGVILHHLARCFGRFAPENEVEAEEVLRWILFDNHKLTSYTATLRWFRTLAKDPADPAVIAFLEGRALAAWKVLDSHLAGRDFVLGAKPTIADISMCAYLFWPEEIGVDWAEGYPRISAWLGRIQELPGWTHPYELMPGHPLPGRD